MQTTKKILAMLLTVSMLFSMFSIMAYAADDQTSNDAGVKIVEESYDSNTQILTLNVQAKLPSETGIKSASVLLSYDSSVLTLMHKTKNDTTYEPTTEKTTRKTAINCLLESDAEDPYNLMCAELYGNNERAGLFVGVGTLDGPSESQMISEWMTIFQVRFKVAGNATDVLNSSSIRIADPVIDADVIRGAYGSEDFYTVSVEDAGANPNVYVYGKMAENSAEISGRNYVMNAEGNATATYTGSTNQSGSGSGGDQTETNTNFEVYYQVDGSDSDNDKFVEIEPGANFEVGVYVKSTDGTTKKLQAFDIYPTWDSMLSYEDVVDNTGKGIVKTEMDKAKPHFYSVMTELNMDVPAEGVKIATLTMKLSNDAVYNTGYKVGLAPATNMAVALNAESVPVAVDTTEKGAETLKTYTVTYNANDGTGAPETQTKEHNVDLPLSNTVPTRAGYSFKDWNTAADGTGTAYAAGATYETNAEVTLYAQWNANTVEVTLDANGGALTGATTSIDVLYGATYSELVDVSDPTKTGYTFAGWFDAVSGGNKITTGSVVNNAEAHKLYAQWTANTYTVKFNANGGSGTMSDMTVEYDQSFTMPENAFAYTGWKFNGWNTAADGSGAAYTAGTTYSNLAASGEVTLYAQWTKASYSISIESDITGGQVELDKQAANYNDTINVTVTPDDGYEIGKVFYTPEGGNAEEITVTKQADGTYTGTFSMPAANVTVSATFTAINYNIVVGNTSNGTVTVDGGKTSANYNDEIKLNVVPDPGYKVGSVTVNGETILATDGEYIFSMPAEDVAINVVFVPATYTVTLDANGGNFAVGSKTSINATYGSTYSELSDVTLIAPDGYEFDVWNTKQDGTGTSITAGDTVSITAGETLYAQWKAKTYTITFVTNGGTFADNSAVTEQDGKFTMTYTYKYANAKLPAITKELHEFVNWTVSYAEGATETGWGDANATINGESVISEYYGDVILTANWKAAFTYAVEDYKYAPAGYVMLRIATDSNTNAYAFDGATMFYTADENYELYDKPVFVTLIPSEGNVETVANKTVLTAAALDKISQTNAVAEEIQRDGQVNMKDTVVNIADANAVYQMVIGTGAYYSLDQLGILNRLEADMDTAIITEGENKSEYRGSILDVHKIVDIINENANSSNTNG